MHILDHINIGIGKYSESVQCAMLKACDAYADMGQLKRTVPIRRLSLELLNTDIKNWNF